MRLQKYLSRFSTVSRRAAERLIVLGRVSVNGRIAGIGEKVDSIADVVRLDGVEVKNSDQIYRYYALNKPAGYVTTMRDELSRKCVLDLISCIKTRVFPVGRLDKDSEGLLLITNDGNFANYVMHPSNRVEKEYIVKVFPKVNTSTLRKLRKGVNFKEEFLATKNIDILSNNGNNNYSILKFTLMEGKNRHIRKMCKVVGLQVLNLKRISIGPIKLNNLGIGKFRCIETPELDALGVRFNSL